MRRAWVAAVCSSALVLVTACAPSGPPKTALSQDDFGGIRFISAANLVRQQPLQPRRFESGPPQEITGDLRFPSEAGRVPAVILLHGCGGLNPLPPREARWASLLRSWGYATFLLDSFSERGLSEVCTTPALSQVQRVPDVYGALHLLATHPRIDPEHIFVLGWSHGAGVALESATEWAVRTFGRVDGPRLRAAIAFYPGCNYETPERNRIALPIRIHSGELDDSTLAAPCVRYTEMLAAAGADAEIIVYPGAQHGFDWPRAPGGSPHALNFGNCLIREASIVGPISLQRGCERRGWSHGYSAGATAEAERRVRDQLHQLRR